MKLICTSLGVAAIGMASVECVQGQSTDLSKPWTVSATLRGFYDDNVNTTPSGSPAKRKDSFGFEVSPSLSLALPMEQTTLTAGYTYSYKRYDEKINSRDGYDENTHTLAAALRHNFNERMTLAVRDSFVIGQEPDTRRVENSAVDSPQYISGDNIRNYGAIIFNAQLTPVFGLEVGYANGFFDYDDDSPGGPSSRLDRLDHAAHIDARWNVQSDTVVFVGYEYALADYTADLQIDPVNAPTVMSDDRNNRSHAGYVGVEHHFSPTLFGRIQAGARYNHFYNSANDETEVSPTVKGSLTYEYAQESNLQVGVSHDRRSTDQFSVSATDPGDYTLDADTTLGYASVTHRILPSLYGSVIGSVQYSRFNGGPIDGDTEIYYALGLNLRYQINRHISTEVGYNYDRVDADSQVTSGDYDRNRAYIGATFAY